MSKITFKEYLESKEVLKEAVKENPPKEQEYLITKYCKIPVFEDGRIVDIKLKPRQQIICEWLYENTDSPLIQNLKFVDYMDDRIYKTRLNAEKLSKWIKRNTNN